MGDGLVCLVVGVLWYLVMCCGRCCVVLFRYLVD